MRQLPKPFTPQQRKKIKALAKTMSAPEIARKLRTEVSRVRRYLKREGITARRATHAPLAGVDLRREVLKHGSVKAVADHYNVTPAAVYARIGGM